MSSDMKGRKIKPGSKNPEKMDFQYIATETIAVGDILFVAGVQGAWLKLEKADSDVLAEARGPLFFAVSPCVANGYGRARAFGTLTDVDTDGATIGDPVYLSGTAGGFSLTAQGALQRKIGTVIRVSATVGEILFDGFSFPTGGQTVVAGTAVILNTGTAVTVTAATLGGAYGGKPVVATMNEVDGTKSVIAAAWSTNDLVITASAAVTDDRTVSYIIAVG